MCVCVCVCVCLCVCVFVTVFVCISGEESPVADCNSVNKAMQPSDEAVAQQVPMMKHPNADDMTQKNKKPNWGDECGVLGSNVTLNDMKPKCAGTN